MGTTYTRENLHDEARSMARLYGGRCAGWHLAGIGTDHPTLVAKVRLRAGWNFPDGVPQWEVIMYHDAGGNYINISCAI